MNIPEMTDEQISNVCASINMSYEDEEFPAVLRFARAILAARDAQYAALAEQEPVAQIVSSGPHDFPLLEWLSADHSFRAPIGSMLYAAPPAHADRTVCAYPDCHCPTETPCLQGLPFSAPTNPAAQDRPAPVAPAVGEVYAYRYSRNGGKTWSVMEADPTDIMPDEGGIVIPLVAATNEDREVWRLLVEAATVEVNEKGAGGYLLARLDDARALLSTTPPAPAQPAINTPEHDAQILDAVRNGRMTFSPGWNAQPSPEPSKPEQAEAPIEREIRSNRAAYDAGYEDALQAAGISVLIGEHHNATLPPASAAWDCGAGEREAVAGFDLVAVKGFGPLIDAMERAARKGYLPDAMLDEWMAFDYRDAPTKQPGKYDDVLQPFVALMERELHANTGKGDRPGWLQMDASTALLEVYYHLAKLQKAVRNNDGPGIQEYAADVANMTMMVLDVCGGIDAQALTEGAPANTTIKRAEWEALSPEAQQRLNSIVVGPKHREYLQRRAKAMEDMSRAALATKPQAEQEAAKKGGV